MTGTERQKWIQESVRWYSLPSRLADVRRTLNKRLKPHLVRLPKGQRTNHRYGDLKPNAPAETSRLRDALFELDGLEVCLRSNNIDNAVKAAWDLALTLYEIGIYPMLRKAVKADADLQNANESKATNTAVRKDATIAAALKVWSEHNAKSLPWVQGILAGQKRDSKKRTIVELSKNEQELSKAIRERFSEVVTRRGVDQKKCLLKKISTIEKHTAGLKRPPASPKLG